MASPRQCDAYRYLRAFLVIWAGGIAIPDTASAEEDIGRTQSPKVKKSFVEAAEVIHGEKLLRPNPGAKFIALETALDGNAREWTKAVESYESRVDPNNLTDAGVAIPTLLGFRICDGFAAIRAHQEGQLASCTGDIEVLGQKLGANDTDLKRGQLVRSFASRGEWNRAFLELGYLQQDLETAFQKHAPGDQKAASRTILHAASWLQGTRYTSNLVRDHYRVEIAGILREPALAHQLKFELESIGHENQAIIEKLAQALEQLGQLADMEIHSTMSPEKVKSMAMIATEAVAEIERRAILPTREREARQVRDNSVSPARTGRSSAMISIVIFSAALLIVLAAVFMDVLITVPAVAWLANSTAKLRRSGLAGLSRKNRE